MPRQTKSMNSTKESSNDVVNVPVVEQQVIEKKKTDNKKTKKSSSVTPPVVPPSVEQIESVVMDVVSPATATTTAAACVSVVENDFANVSLSVKLNIFGAKLQQLAGLISSVKSDFKVLEKLVAKDLKNAQKSSRKKKSNPNRQPSGFVKPTRISDELAQFLGKNIGCEMARTEVSKEINAYICSNKLQDKTNGRIIKADAKLSNLLKLNKEDELTYFNLQRYMKHHFIKNEPVVSATI
jgi:chromatin remodeling complex protein RSC6